MHNIATLEYVKSKYAYSCRSTEEIGKCIVKFIYLQIYLWIYLPKKSTRHFWCFASERQIASLRMHYNMLTEYKYLKDIIITKYILFCINQCLFFLLNWAWAYWFRAEMNYRVISKRFALSLCTCTMYTHYICLHNSNCKLWQELFM